MDQQNMLSQEDVFSNGPIPEETQNYLAKFETDNDMLMMSSPRRINSSINKQNTN